MAGRNKEPIDLLIAKGKKHLTKEEIAERKESEIKAPCDNITTPTYLTNKEKKEFMKIAEELVKLDIMSNLDVDTLARFVTSKSMYEKLSKKARSPEVCRDINLLEAYSKIQDRYFKACRSAAIDLGLTITSRCKIVVPKPQNNEKKANKFAQFEKRKIE